MHVGLQETRLYLWAGLIVMAERVRVSNSEQFPQQPGPLAEPLHAWLPSVAWPSELPLPTRRMAASGERHGVMLCLGVGSATQLLCDFRQVTSVLQVSVFFI